MPLRLHRYTAGETPKRRGYFRGALYIDERFGFVLNKALALLFLRGGPRMIKGTFKCLHRKALFSGVVEQAVGLLQAFQPALDGTHELTHTDWSTS